MHHLIESFLSKPFAALLLAVRQHPYFSLSVLLHLIAIVWVCYFGIYTLVVKTQNAHISSSTQKAYQLNIEARIANMEQLEVLLKETIDKNKIEQHKPSELSLHNEVSIQKTKTPQELLNQAVKVSESIKKIDQSLRAEALERVMIISHDDALKKVASLDSSIPEIYNTNISRKDLVKAVENLENKAEDVLRRRQIELERQQVGIPVSFFKDRSYKFGEHGDGYDGNNGGSNAFVDARTLDDISSHLKNNGGIGGFKRNNFVDVWLNHIPAVGMTDPHKKMGRVIKAGGEFADRIFVNSWYMIGPFSQSIDKHPPEYAIDLDAAYSGKNNQVVNWQYINSVRYPLTPPQQDKLGVFYGYTEIMLDNEQDLWVWVGADEFASLWLNGVSVWASDTFNWKFNALISAKDQTERKNWNLTECKRRVHFNKGRNTFIFKLTNVYGSGFFSLILTKS